MGENEIELNCRLEKEDYVSLFYISSCAFTQIKWYIAVAVVLLFDVVAMIITLFPNARGSLGFGTAFASMLVFLTGTVYMLFYPRFYRSIARKNVAARYENGSLSDAQKQYVFDERGLRINSGQAVQVFAWQQVRQVREDPLALVISFRDFDSTCLIPKRCVNAQFRTYLRGKLPRRVFVLYP